MTHPERQRPPRLLGLDPGSRRTGVAISDELGLFAHPRPAIHASDAGAAVEAVARLVADEGVSEVVVGLPLNLSGGESEQTAEARAFARRIRERCGVPVSVFDERLSSVQAARDVRGAARRKSGELDSAAAVVVLQAALDRRRREGEP